MSRIIEEEGKKLGIKVFLDEKDIEGGESIPKSIRKNIKKCNEFLVFLSPYSIKSSWVSNEIGAAWVLGKRIIAIIDKVAPKEIADIISSKKAFALDDFDRYLKQLILRAKRGK